MFWRRTVQRTGEYDGDAVRAGAGPTDNLVVLIVSLAVLCVIGAGLLWYFNGSAMPGVGNSVSIGK